MSETSRGLELNEPASPEALIPDIGLWPWFAGAALLLVVLAAVLVLRIDAGRKAIRTQRATPPSPKPAPLGKRITGSMPADAAVQCLADPAHATCPSPPVIPRCMRRMRNSFHAMMPCRRSPRKPAPPRKPRSPNSRHSNMRLKFPAADPADIIGQARILLDHLHRGFAA